MFILSKNKEIIEVEDMEPIPIPITNTLSLSQFNNNIGNDG